MLQQQEPVKPASVAAAASPSGGKRRMSLGQFVFIAFFLTCGGPFGLEPAVQAGGIAATIGGLLILPIIWSIPQSLMTAELSSMMSVNGGGLVWVWRGLGTCAGVANAYNSLASALVDICLYPNLIVEYCPSSLSFNQRYLIKVAILTGITICNIVGLNLVGLASVLLMVVSLSVFVVELPFALPAISSVDFLHTPEFNLATLAAVLLWSSTGWDSLGNFAGEVKNPTRTYPVGIALAMVAGMAAYMVPVLVSYMLLPDPSQWNGNAFLLAAENATGPGSWLVIWVVIAAVLSNLGQPLTGCAATSRLMWAMGACNKDEGIQMRTLPKMFGYIWPRFETPVVALVVQLFITSFISYWDFETLVQFLALLNCVRLSLEFASFILLKYKEPMADRPFVVPGGLVGAWVITGIMVAVLGVVMVEITYEQPVVAAISLVVNVIIVVAASYLGGPDCHPCAAQGIVLNDDDDDLKAPPPASCC